MEIRIPFSVKRASQLRAISAGLRGASPEFGNRVSKPKNGQSGVPDRRGVFSEITHLIIDRWEGILYNYIDL